jgi:hypothetical protein
MQVAVEDQAAPRHKEMHLVHQAEAKREKDQRGNEDSISDHAILSAASEVRAAWSRQTRRGVSLSAKKSMSGISRRTSQ